MRSSNRFCRLFSLALFSTLPVSVLGGDVLSTNGFTSCLSNSSVQVKNLDVTYNKNTRVLNFNVAGTSDKVQNVTATLIVSAYGEQVYKNSFNPCDTGMPEMCPVPAASFASNGQQTIPAEYASKIPSIAFSIPDLDGTVKMELQGDDGQDVGCIESTVTNGHTLSIPAVSYAAVGIAAAALVLSAVSSLVAGGHPGSSSPSPTFTETMGWFQGMAMNGMMSVSYPDVYRSFSTNFAFSTGLVPWGSLQISIDNFRAMTGGNLTDDNYQYLKNNATLVYADDSNGTSSAVKRALDGLALWARDGTEVSVNGTSATFGGATGGNSSAPANTKSDHLVSGIQSYVEQLTIPQANTFMTVLLIWCIIVAVIIVFILLLKVILEAWAMMGELPKAMESWRQRYWWRLAKALTNLTLVLYGSWTLYCIYQFTNGDSWAAKLLAATTLALFTLVLLAFTWRIYSKAHQYRQLDGDTSKLYEDKETWLKYNLFYENYKKSYWWLFVPTIVYMFARGAIIAGANGHGLVQAAGQLIVEALFLGLLLWSRPYQRRSGVWINIFIQVVRVLSVVCILVFVEELGISQTTKTITGVVLIVVQCVLTAALAVLIAVNSLITCVRENPHRRQRKQNEKLSRDLDTLTPLDARNSLLMEPMAQRAGPDAFAYKSPAVVDVAPFGAAGAGVGAKGRYDRVPPRAASPPYSDRSFSRPARARDGDDRDALMSSAASMGHRTDRSVSPPPPRERQPRLPDLDFGRAY